jgi:hypothetical protein
MVDRVSKELEKDVAKRAARYGAEPPSQNAASNLPIVARNTPSDQSGEQSTTASSSPWRISKTSNELTGEVNVTAISGHGDQSIIIRRLGKKFDFYATTGQFLETVDNIENRRSLVKYKFDEGHIVRQERIISDDNEALFFPGNPTTFFQKMSKAKRFVIEFQPADVIAQTASFDVSSFPSEFSTLRVGPIRR